jgi:uncharacterized protein (TIGR02231 family)
MIRLFLLAATVLFAFVATAATPVRVSPVVKEVTVYRSGAKLTSVARVAVPAGRSEVIFENLTSAFNPQSLQVRLGGDVTLNTAVFQLKMPAPVAENPRVKIIRDSIVILGDMASLLQAEKEVYDSEYEILSTKSQQIGTLSDKGHQNLDIAQLRDLVEFYRQRMLDLKKQQHRLRLLQRTNGQYVQALQNELQNLYPNTSNSSGEIVMKIESPVAQTIEIACTYLALQASWSPLYDVHANGLDKPLQLVYKANVFNSTGFDWKNVKLSLSTAVPLVNNNRPILSPVFVDFRVIPQPVRKAADRAQLNTNMYQLQEAVVAESELTDIISYKVPLVAALEEPQEFLSTFDVAKPQDIPANGEMNVVIVEERDMPAEYQYHAVPKLDASAFLLAKVADYGKYNLLAGTANIFFRDTYVGQTFINPNVTADTLLISLGRDEQISIKRIQPKDFTARKKILSNTVKESFAYEITVRNNKTIPISIEILDQVPVSKQEGIEVEVEDKDGAEYTETYGKLLWKLEIKAGQSKKIKFAYAIKYPKDKNISMLKGQE